MADWKLRPVFKIPPQRRWSGLCRRRREQTLPHSPQHPGAGLPCGEKGRSETRDPHPRTASAAHPPSLSGGNFPTEGRGDKTGAVLQNRKLIGVVIRKGRLGCHVRKGVMVMYSRHRRIPSWTAGSDPQRPSSHPDPSYPPAAHRWAAGVPHTPILLNLTR